MIGRSHGIHAEPITFGLKMALWHTEMERNRERMVRAKETISTGKLSGAVGTFSFVDPAIEDVRKVRYARDESLDPQLLAIDRAHEGAWRALSAAEEALRVEAEAQARAR